MVLFPDSRQRDGFVRQVWGCWMRHGNATPLTRQRDKPEYWQRCAAIPSNVRLQLQGKPHAQLSVDNLEEVLAHMFGQQVDIVTTSDPVLTHYEADVDSAASR